MIIIALPMNLVVRVGSEMGLKREAHLTFEKYFEVFITYSFTAALATRRGKTHLR